MIRRILVAVEEDAEGSCALRYGVNLAGILGAELQLIHVVEEARVYPGWGPLVGHKGEKIDGRKRKMESEVERHRKGTELEVGLTIKEGLYPAGEVIVELHEGDYDLLVTGSRGECALLELLLGGISSQIIHHAKKPVIVVKSMRGISRILMCTAGCECSFDAIRYAAGMAEAAGADVVVLSVSELDTTESISRAWEFAREGTGILRERGVRAEALVRVGRPAEEILAEARRRDFDLIVMGYMGRSAVADILLGEVASKVLHRSLRSVLIFRE
ncbi:MAG: universal stress protein [Thermoplasmata archaeon]|nr:universal stress protein [Thermoplasmata archaeon]